LSRVADVLVSNEQSSADYFCLFRHLFCQFCNLQTFVIVKKVCCLVLKT
jgi:hypothetical protein